MPLNVFLSQRTVGLNHGQLRFLRDIFEDNYFILI